MEGTIGEIRLFAGNFAPMNWAFCGGTLMSIAEYTALYSILGTAFGGDGNVTFALPDLRGRVPVGTGNGPGLSNFDLGQTGGSTTVTLNSTNLPTHSHLANGNITIQAVSNATDASTDPSGRYLSNAVTAYSGNLSESAQMQPTPYNVASNYLGNNLPLNIVAPYTGMNYVICLEGIYPSRP